MTRTVIVLNAFATYPLGWSQVCQRLSHRGVPTETNSWPGWYHDLPDAPADLVGAMADEVTRRCFRREWEREPLLAGDHLGALVALTVASRNTVAGVVALAPAGLDAPPGRRFRRATDAAILSLPPGVRSALAARAYRRKSIGRAPEEAVAALARHVRDGGAAVRLRRRQRVVEAAAVATHIPDLHSGPPTIVLLATADPRYDGKREQLLACGVHVEPIDDEYAHVTKPVLVADLIASFVERL